MTTTHRSGFLPSPIRMTLNDLECLIQVQLNVSRSHGLLADSVDTSLASLLYRPSCKTDAVLSEMHDQ